jgi:O-antigen/teichoic acid export membrane protein/glycosyltransferase involved in cell wall biosynthesis
VDQGEVRRLAVKGAGATVLSSTLALGLQIIATMVLARLLTPADFGLVAMVTTFSLLLGNFGLNGFTEAVLQAEEINRFLISNLFWINIGTGLLLAAGFAGAGSLLARFYGDPHVVRVAVAISPAIFISSISVQHLALLKRGMRYSAVSANDIIARVVSVAVSILLGWAGWGYWALVVGIVALPLSTSIGAWFLCPWIPSLPRRVAGTGSMLRFAINVYGRFGINYLARNTDNLLVGWRFGALSLGFYKKAYDLFALPVSQTTAPLTNVAVSALSRFREDPTQYRSHLLGAVEVMAFMGMGLSADLTLVGKDLIRVLLGPGWESAGHIFTFFGPGIGAMLIYYIHGWIHLSIGRADRWLRWGVVEVSVTFLLFVLALPWGPVGIAAAWTASFWILTIPGLYYAGRPIGFGVAPVLAVVWKFVLASLLAGCLCEGMIRQTHSLIAASGWAATFGRIVTVSFLFATLYLGLVIVFHWGYLPLLRVWKLLREMVAWDRFSPLPVIPVAACDIEGPILSESTQETFAWNRLRKSGTEIHSLPAPETAHTADQAPPPSPVGTQVGSVKPLVSILIPAFNAQEWIADTLRSAISQTYEPKEIIVVDDGSTDQTLAVARQFESSCVRVVTQKNQGGSAARNKAFSFSRGDYIQWLDADDLLAPDKIARQVEVLGQCRSERTLLSSAFGHFLYRPQRAKFFPTALWSDLSPIEWLMRKMGENVYLQTATWLVSRELTEAAGPWDTRLLGDDDGEYFCRVLLASDGVRFVPEAKVYYRGPSLAFGGLSHIGQSSRKVDAHWLSMQLHIHYLRSLEDSDRVRTVCLRYLQTSFIYFYPERSEIVKQAEEMARGLGGQLRSPHLSWKYSWVKMILGWRLAKRFQQLLLNLRWGSERLCDKALYRIERRKSTHRSGYTKTELTSRKPITSP